MHQSQDNNKLSNNAAGDLTETHETPFFWVNLKKNQIWHEANKDTDL